MNSAVPFKVSVARAAGRSFLLLLLAALFVAVPATDQLSPSAQKQIAEIYAFKASFTAAEKKMSTNLVMRSRAAHRRPLGALAKFLTPLPVDATGKFDVEVIGSLTPSLMTSPAMRGVETVNGAVPAYAYSTGHIRTRLGADQLLELAGHSDVKFIREPTGGHSNVGSATSQGYVAHGVNKVAAGRRQRQRHQDRRTLR